MLEAWDEHRNLVRRVIGCGKSRPGRLEIEVERFGKRTGWILLLDAARPGSQMVERQGRRMVFRERFRHFLRRQFPGWPLGDLTTEADLEHTLSPAYPRAFVHRGSSGWAALAVPPGRGNDARALTFGIIWLDYLRRRERRRTVEGLLLLLPEGRQRTTCLRLRYLRQELARFSIFVYTEDGYEEPVDARDHGNLESHLETCRGEAGGGVAAPAWMDDLRRLPFVEVIRRNDGGLSYRVRGLEFARVAGHQVSFGIERRRRAGVSDLSEIRRLASELARLRSPGAADTANPLYTRHPEAWLESQIRAHPEIAGAELVAEPIYGQVPAFAGGERDVIDLLAAERSGRLVVLELKAEADPHLPMQALDYWMRVRLHAEAGEFSRRGYFPGLPLSRQPPRLLLIAPALEFHPTTETILSYFSPSVPVERIGLGMDWRRQPKAAFRAPGARKPGT